MEVPFCVEGLNADVSFVCRLVSDGPAVGGEGPLWEMEAVVLTSHSLPGGMTGAGGSSEIAGPHPREVG